MPVLLISSDFQDGLDLKAELIEAVLSDTGRKSVLEPVSLFCLYLYNLQCHKAKIQRFPICTTYAPSGISSQKHQPWQTIRNAPI